LQRLESLNGLSGATHARTGCRQQIGIRLTIQTSPNEVHGLRGISILVHEQTGLCRKTRRAHSGGHQCSLELRPTSPRHGGPGLFSSRNPPVLRCASASFSYESVVSKCGMLG
jgi:hypothetical protein